MSKTQNSTYENYIKDIASNICSETKFPTCAQYEKAVAKKMNEDEYYPSYNVEPRNIHSSVYRALTALCKRGEFLNVGKYYYPNKGAYRRKHYAKLIKQSVRFSKKDIHIISNNTCIVSIEPARPECNYTTTNEEIIDLFKNFIGESSCYDLKFLDNLLIILLRKSDDITCTTISHIEELVKETHDNQPPLKMKLKRIKQM